VRVEIAAEVCRLDAQRLGRPGAPDRVLATGQRVAILGVRCAAPRPSSSVTDGTVANVHTSQTDSVTPVLSVGIVRPYILAAIASLRRTAVIAALIAVAAPAPAVAGGPGIWTPLGTTDQLNISDLASLARTRDGTLHVAWHRRIASSSTYDLLTTPVSPAGAVGASVPVVTGWVSIGGPTLLAEGDGLALFFSGPRTNTTGDPTDGLDVAFSGGGQIWRVDNAAIAVGDFVSARDASVAAVGSTFLESWYAGQETVVHAGIYEPTAPNQRGYGDGANQGVASDGTTALVAWCTDVQGPNGVFVQPIDPGSGAPAGPASLMPGSTDVNSGVAETSCPASARVPIVARVGGGYYVVSTDGTRRVVRVWRVGTASSATLAAGTSFKQQLALTSAPDGRIWVGWIDGEKLTLRRSNKAATVFGATVTVRASPPSSAGSVYQLDLSAQADRVDAVARTDGTGAGPALYHTQSYPGLTLSATGSRRASFRVTDAGDPVAGATITVAGRKLTTSAQGRASVRPSPGSYTATASKSKYVSATAKIRITR
jgi:hypothetical protein